MHLPDAWYMVGVADVGLQQQLPRHMLLIKLLEAAPLVVGCCSFRAAALWACYCCAAAGGGAICWR
jgi:hypothetical protein